MKLYRFFIFALVLTLYAAPVQAIQPSSHTSNSLEQKKFSKSELQVSSVSEPLDNVMNFMPYAHNKALQRFTTKYGNKFHFHIDPRSGTPTNVIGHIPLIPGNGKDNHITKEHLSQGLGRNVTSTDAGTVAEVTRKFIQDNQDVLNLDVSQVGAVTAEKVSNNLWQLQVRQTVNGIKVRGARLAVTISHGNLVMFGTERWGNVQINTTPKIKADEALKLGFQYAGGQLPTDRILAQPGLEIVPTAPLSLQDGDRYVGSMGKGYEHRLVWTFTFKRPPESATWEVLIDADSGDILSFLDINQYAASNISGGVYPITNTEVCPANTCCGVMQADQPMPFADTGLPTPDNFTNSAGLFTYDSGDVVTKLAGKYVRIQDNCGAVSESVFGSGGLDLGGANGQHDCVSGGSSPGNTAAARSAFYEINRIQEMARGYLPNNSWLQGTLTTNVNIDDTCNAYWDGDTINFFKSGGGCRNTGEIAQVFDHEWGHGLDANDGNGPSSPGESYADIAAMYRLQTSCMGHGFFESLDRNCGRTADNTGFNTNLAQIVANRCALNCSGVRETDWDQLTGPAHTPSTTANFVCTRCTVSNYGYNGPCGREAHCESAVDTQSAWDFVARDLQSPPFSYDANTAFLVGSRIFFQAAGNIGNWHTCSCAASTSNGCGATNAYMQWLAADDDDGDIGNGTPHMTALYNAFNRHGIACETPVPVNSGCAGAPSAAPVLTASPGTNKANLSWNADLTASRYSVFRTEGVAGCNTGKTPIATVTGNSVYTDLNLANDRQYCYTVMAVGESDACFSPASSCVCTTPLLGLHGTLRGGVSDAATGSPIGQAIVTVTGGYATTSNGSGTYRIDDLLPGSYDITVSRYGYQTRSYTGVIINGGEVVMDFSLTAVPMVTVHGTVNDGSGHGWPLYAKIAITTPGYTDAIYTDPVTGSYSINLFQNTVYTFTVGSTGYNAATREVTGSAGGNGEDFSLTVDPLTCAPGYGMLDVENFENSNGGYSVSGTSSWAWGVPISGPSTAHSGKRVWGTRLTGNYLDGEDGYITSRPIDLSRNAGQPSVLSWWQWLETEGDFDNGYVEVSDDNGASWTVVYGPVSGSNPYWTRKSVTLPAAYSVGNVRIRFHFSSDFSINFSGWYIDDVSVTPQSGCQLEPGGLLVGNVRDFVSGAGLNSAVVTDNSGHSAATTATPSDNALDDGYYTLFLPVGQHDVTALSAGYDYESVTGKFIAADSVSRQDFSLIMPLTVTSAPELPFAVTATAYSHTLTVAGGNSPYTWAITSGALPAGLTLNATTGIISGSSAMVGTFAFTVRVTNFNGTSATKLLTISVYESLSVSTTTLPVTVAGSLYRETLTARGGLAPYAWSSSGMLPPGLSLNEWNGVISGTPSATGTFPFTAIVLDANGSSAFQPLTIVVNGPLTISAFQPANGAVVPVDTTVQATFSAPLNPASVTTGNFSLSRVEAPMAIAAGLEHTVALKSDGTVVAWGFNDYGQTNVPAGLNGVTAIAAGNVHTVALKSDGKVVAWGSEGSNLGATDVPAGLSGVIALAASNEHTLALKSDGTVVAWGWDYNGVDIVPEGLTGITAIASGQNFNLALKSDGQVVAWGRNNFGQATVPEGLSGVIAIAAGSYHALALKSDGTVVAWGWGLFGATQIPSGLSGVTAIAAGEAYSVALKNDGTVVAWGWNNLGQTSVPAGLSGVKAIATGENHVVALKNDAVALRSEGTVIAWGGNTYGQTTVPAGLGFSGKKVSGTVTYDEETRTVTFTPLLPLLDSVAYGARVAGIVSQTGMPLAAPVNWSFSAYEYDYIKTEALPFGIVGSGYNQTLEAAGGVAPYAWTIASGTLPVGVTLDSASGLLAGTPTVEGSYTFSVRAVDAASHAVARSLTIKIYSPLIITTSSLPLSTPGAAYSQNLAASGGKTPYKWTISSDTLPAGLSLDPATGVIAGTPTATGLFSFTVLAADLNDTAAYRSLSIAVYAPLQITAYQPASAAIAPADASVQITFNEGLDPASFNGANFKLARVEAPKAVSAGNDHTLVLKSDGTVATWGSNDYNELNVPANLAGVTAISAGGINSMALKSDGTVVVWGDNFFEQLVVPPGLSGVTAIAAGYQHNLALKSDGTVAAWGWNNYGQATVPADLGEVIAISGGFNFSLALKSDGTVVAWGRNDAGQTDVPAGLSDVVAIAAGYMHALALKGDGTVVAWGGNILGAAIVPKGLYGVTAITAGSDYSVALKNDGTLVGWGYGNLPGGFQEVPAGLSGVTAVAAGGGQTIALRNNAVALRNDSTVVAWGSNSYGQIDVPTGLSLSGSNAVNGAFSYNATSLTATFTPTAPLPGNVTFYARVGAVTSQIGVPLAAPFIWSFRTYDLDITTSALPHGSTGSSYSQALGVSGGTAPYSWAVTSGTLPHGLSLDINTGGISGTLTAADTSAFTVRVTDTNGTICSKILEITCHPTVTAILPANGAVVPVTSVVQATFSDPLNPASIINGGIALSQGMVANPIAAGDYHTMALKSDATVAAWGWNAAGQIAVPVDLVGVAAIAAGSTYSLALKNDGTVVAWGDGTNSQTSVPAGLADVVAIAAGSYHAMALKSDGTLVGWGSNALGQTTPPFWLSGVTAIDAGEYHTVALKGDGTVVAWGYNSYGQTSVPPGLNDVTAIAVGKYHSLALKGDGTIVAWGSNYQGQSAVPDGLSDVIAIAAGGYHSVALKRDGTVVAWGQNNYGQTSVPADLSGVVAIAAGGYHTVAMKSDHTLVAWGFSSAGQTTTPANLSLGGNAVSGTVVYDAAAQSATFTPAEPLALWATYAARVADVTSLKGIPLVAPVDWSFSTHNLLLTTGSLANGVIDVPFNQSLAASGGRAPYTWSIASGSLPAGLSLDAASGTISGTPTAYGAQAIGFQVTDADGLTAGKTLSIRITYPFSIATTALSAGLTGAAYNQTLTVAGGYAPFTWSITGGTLPAGVDLDPATGIISGIPAAVGSSTITFQVADVNDTIADKTLSITITAGPLVFASTALPDGYRTAVYSAALSALGGTPPYTWSRTSGTLPTGLTLNSGTGVISGTPTATGSKTVTFRVRDAASVSTSKSLTITIYTLPTISTTTLVNGLTGTAYSQTLAASGGKTPYTWSLTGGGLPPGIGLDSGGHLAGVPTLAGDYTVIVQAADANGTAVAKALTITVYAPLLVETLTLPVTVTGAVYNQLLSASGGAPPYNWSISSGTLPTGLSLENSSGIISGTPTATGNYLFTVTVADTVGGSASRPYSLDVYTPLTISARQPSDGATVAVDTAVQATFSEPLDPATVTADNFRLSRAETTRAVAAGDFHTVALKEGGSVVIWGFGEDGETIVPAGLSGVTDIAAGGYHTLALKGDGTVAAWGYNVDGETDVPAGLSGITAISAGGYHSLAMKSDNTVVAWGLNDDGQSTAPAGLSGVTAIAAGQYHSLALKSDGTVVAWGYNEFGQTTVPVGLSGVTAIAAGGYHNLALKGDGTVVAWGLNDDGQTTVPANLDGIVAVAAGLYHSVALKSDGTVVAWGWNQDGQTSVPAGLTAVFAISAGASHTVALQNDGTVIAWGDDSYSQTTAPADLIYRGNSVIGNLAYDTALLTATFTPAAPLRANSTYRVRVADITSQTGVPLAAPVSWGFGTHDVMITSTGLPSGTTGTAYSQPLTATGGVVPYTWSIGSGSLPAGISLDGASGLLAGTPTTAGSYTFTVQATDAQTRTASKPLTMSIYLPVSISTPSLPYAVPGSAYSQSLAASGGVPPYSWSISSGALPAGLTLDSSTGVISGAPSVAGEYSFSVRAASSTSSDTRPFSLTVRFPAIRVPGVSARYFDLPQGAYNALSDGETAELAGVEFIENLNCNRDVTVVVGGGYAKDFSGIDSVTTLRGSVKISRGKVVIKNLILRPRL